MIVAILVPALTPVHSRSPSDGMLLVAWLLIVAIIRRSEKRPTEWGIGDSLWLEELFVFGLVWLVFGNMKGSELGSLAAFTAGSFGCFLLLRRAPLPDWPLPLRGIWLRRLLALLSLAGVAHGGGDFWAAALYSLPVWQAIAMGELFLWLTLSLYLRLVARGDE